MMKDAENDFFNYFLREDLNISKYINYVSGRYF